MLSRNENETSYKITFRIIKDTFKNLFSKEISSKYVISDNGDTI